MRIIKTEARDAGGERESTFGLSLYPQLMLNNSTRSVAREIAEPGPQLLLPLEASAKVGLIRVSGEVGYWFTTKNVPHSWIRGVIVGHEFRKDTELYLELYDQQDVTAIGGNLKPGESTFGIGGRFRLSHAAFAPVDRHGGPRNALLRPVHEWPAELDRLWESIPVGTTTKTQR
jgi:hypothetical protein